MKIKSFCVSKSRTGNLLVSIQLLRYKTGEAFVHMPHARAMKRLQRDQETVDAQVAELTTKADECETEMKRLKVVLYAKFGKAINLDE